MFQSTPPVAEGRCPPPIYCWIGRVCFNPRPPLPRGDAFRRGSWPFVPVVSIHAPRCRGAMQAQTDVAGANALFQSTPPVAEGRCDLYTAYTRWCRGFNPRPPLPRGDAPRPTARQQGVGMFQSTPPVAEGRCLGVGGGFAANVVFQSTPPVAEGRCRSVTGCQLANRVVSIHAPRCRGAMPTSPALMRLTTVVSIHAPRCRGAMPPSTRSRFAGFNSFNPRPPLPRGDAAVRETAGWPGTRFNPRPPLPRGDAC